MNIFFSSSKDYWKYSFIKNLLFLLYLFYWFFLPFSHLQVKVIIVEKSLLLQVEDSVEEIALIILSLLILL